MEGPGSLPGPVAALARQLDVLGEGPAPGGEFGAWYVRDLHGRPLVLKATTGAHRAARWERGMTIARRLRSVGYPTPEYVGAGASGHLVWSLQERLPGEIPAVLRQSHVSRLLEVAALHADAAADLEPIGSEEPRLALSLDGVKALAHDRRRVSIAAQVERVLQVDTRAAVRSTAACHGDFHHRNLLTDGDTVTGVFDWDGRV